VQPQIAWKVIYGPHSRDYLDSWGAANGYAALPLFRTCFRWLGGSLVKMLLGPWGDSRKRMVDQRQPLSPCIDHNGCKNWSWGAIGSLNGS
jgi:hypothetical protein